MITKNTLIIWLCVGGVFAQVLIPGLIVLLAMFSFIGTLSAHVSISGGASVWKIRKEWLLPLFFMLASTVGSGGNAVSISYFLNFISMYFLVIFAITTLNAVNIAKILSIIMALSLLGAVIQFIFMFNADMNSISQLSFIFSDRNELGMYLAAGYVASWYLLSPGIGKKGLRRVAILAILVILPLLMFALGSRSALLGFLSAIISYFFFIRQVNRIIILSVFLSFVILASYLFLPSELLGGLRLLNPESSTNNSDILRLSLFVISWQLFSENPVIGVGPNQFVVESAKYLPDVLQDFSSDLILGGGLVTHNSFLQYFVELGFIIGIFVILRVFKIAKLYFVFRNRRLHLPMRRDLAFLFASSLVFLISGFFLNLHSSIFFIFVIFGIDRLIKKTVYQSFS